MISKNFVTGLKTLIIICYQVKNLNFYVTKFYSISFQCWLNSTNPIYSVKFFKNQPYVTFVQDYPDEKLNTNPSIVEDLHAEEARGM